MADNSQYPLEGTGQGIGGYIVWAFFWRVVNDLKNQINNISGGGSVTMARFSAPFYVNSKLSGKTPDQGFNVWSANGSGTLLNVNDGYTFSGSTITVDVDSGDYLVIIQ